MQAEKVARDLIDAYEAVGGQASPVPALAAVLRRLERRAAQAPELVDPSMAALNTAIVALEEAGEALAAAMRAAEYDPREQERVEERLFALRGGRPQIRRAGRRAWPMLAAGMARDLAGARRERELARPAGGRADGGGGRLRRAGAGAVGGAQAGGGEARPRREGGAAAAEAGAGALHHPDRERRDARAGRKASTGSSSGSRPIRARVRAR